jgi:hypothetical protein
MKKVLVFASLVFAASLLLASCKSSSKCAAYGETHKFQREVKY